MFKNKMKYLWLFVAFLSLNGFTFAGDLEPTAPPAPTMKTLDEIPPTWSQKLPAADRFELVLDEAAVLDKETGCVWEQSHFAIAMSWNPALAHCITRQVGGRRGWHLPTVEQLASLVDSTQSNPALSSGHPFSSEPSGYWTMTMTKYDTTRAWVVGFSGGGSIDDFNKDDRNFVWCVRGGQHHTAN